MKTLLPPIGFWSYARFDDDLFNKRVTRLHDRIESELQLSYGRDPVNIFQDTSAIAHGTAWAKETIERIHKSTFLIPIVTPNFIQSEWCSREVREFLAREEELSRLHPELRGRSRIFPIYYRQIRDRDAHDPELIEILNKLERCDLDDVRDLGFANPRFKRKLRELVDDIRDLLLIEVEAPPTDEELARREAEAEAERKREAAAKRREVAEARKREREDEERRAAEQAEAEAAHVREEEARRHQEALRLEEKSARLGAAEEDRRRAADVAKAEAARRREAEEKARGKVEARKRLEEEIQRRWRAENERLERGQAIGSATEIEAADVPKPAVDNDEGVPPGEIWDDDVASPEGRGVAIALIVVVVVIFGSGLIALYGTLN